MPNRVAEVWRRSLRARCSDHLRDRGDRHVGCGGDKSQSAGPRRTFAVLQPHGHRRLARAQSRPPAQHQVGRCRLIPIEAACHVGRRPSLRYPAIFIVRAVPTLSGREVHRTDEDRRVTPIANIR